jgi:hypothetical protein
MGQEVKKNACNRRLKRRKTREKKKEGRRNGEE